MTLPPGQVETTRFPVVGESGPAAGAPDGDAWRLSVRGLVERGLDLSLDDLRALPQEDVSRDLHCVTRWTRRGLVFRGPPLRAVLDRAGVRPAGRFVRLVAWSDRGHDTSIPLRLALEGTWLVHTLDGAPLPREHGGPLRTLTPARYLYKSLKWVRRVEVLAEDRLGFWERDEGYHNDADPQTEQRYVAGDVKRSVLASLVASANLSPFRGKMLLGADLRGWDPKDRDLKGLVLKNCDLRDARLAGTDLRDACLVNSDLRGADLEGADLRGTDLEGVRLAGAQLADADARGASLIGTLFFEPDDPDGGASVTGLRWSASANLLETMEAWLRSRA